MTAGVLGFGLADGLGADEAGPPSAGSASATSSDAVMAFDTVDRTTSGS